MSPDPAGLAVVSLTDPQSWNWYAYVDNSPVGAVDDLGLECKLATGINTHAGTKDNLAQQFGIDDVIYTYPAGGKFLGSFDVAAQAIDGVNDNTTTLANGVNQFNPDTNNTLFIVSGSGQSLSTAYTSGLLSNSAYNSIQYFVYISPGSSLFSVLPGGDNRLKFHGKGPVDFVVTLFSRFHGGHGVGLPCSHGDLACQLGEIKKRAPQVFKNCTGAVDGGGGGELGGGNGFNGWVFGSGVIFHREGSDVWNLGQFPWWSPTGWNVRADGFWWPSGGLRQPAQP